MLIIEYYSHMSDCMIVTLCRQTLEALKRTYGVENGKRDAKTSDSSLRTRLFPVNNFSYKSVRN